LPGNCHLNGRENTRDIARSKWLASFRQKKGKKERCTMAKHEDQRGQFFIGFLMGSVLGALAGIFFAPKSGKELRSDIKEKGSEVLKDAKEIYADATAKAKEIIEEAKHQAQELKKEADRHLSEARQKAKEILARGEKKEA
jgi:gas vesicle protein